MRSDAKQCIPPYNFFFRICPAKPGPIQYSLRNVVRSRSVSGLGFAHIYKLCIVDESNRSRKESEEVEKEANGKKRKRSLHLHILLFPRKQNLMPRPLINENRSNTPKHRNQRNQPPSKTHRPNLQSIPIPTPRENRPEGPERGRNRLPDTMYRAQDGRVRGAVVE